MHKLHGVPLRFDGLHHTLLAGLNAVSAEDKKHQPPAQRSSATKQVGIELFGNKIGVGLTPKKKGYGFDLATDATLLGHDFGTQVGAGFEHEDDDEETGEKPKSRFPTGFKLNGGVSSPLGDLNGDAGVKRKQSRSAPAKAQQEPSEDQAKQAEDELEKPPAAEEDAPAKETEEAAAPPKRKPKARKNLKAANTDSDIGDATPPPKGPKGPKTKGPGQKGNKKRNNGNSNTGGDGQ